MPRGQPVARLALVLALLFLCRGRADGAQSAAAPVPPDDSLAILRRARDAQRAFERTRLANLPDASDDGRARCDVTIGRFCYWYETGGDTPPEPSRIDAARAGLLDALGDAARMLPGDPWIAGQRVRYLVEHGRLNGAVAAARDCRAEHWWCAALEGFAQHALEDEERADSAFAQALAAMPPEERCAWLDLTPVLGDEAGRYAKFPCVARGDANLRIWWLGRPLYTRPGNDLRTEHYARHVMARMRRDSQSAGSLVWGPDLTELIVRYGWPVAWSRPRARSPGSEPPGALGHERSPSWWFYASAEVPPAWDLNRERPTSTYAPTYATAFAAIREAQIARFRRGDSLLTVAGFDLSTDTTLKGRLPRVALAVGTDAASPIVVGRAVTASHGAVAVRSIDPPAVVSLEAVHDTARWAARVRAATADPTAWLTSPLSDLLLVRAEAAAAGAVEPLTATALPGPSFPAGPVGLYWEWYQRPAPGTVITTQAWVARVGGKGPPSPLGRSECAPAAKTAIALQWRDTLGTHPLPPGRAVALDLGRLDPGRYVIAVSVQLGAEAPQCTSRDVELRRP